MLRDGASGPLHWSVLHSTLSARRTKAFNVLPPHFPPLVDVPSVTGITPLARASANGNLEAVRKFLRYNADVLHCEKNRPNVIVAALAYN